MGMFAPGQAGQLAVYKGEISAVNNAAFFKRYAGKPVAQLDINSVGGEVEAGIELGLWVHRHGLDVTVTGLCLSSCANYVFTAGRHKDIKPGAVVAWHGNYHHLEETGLWRDDVALRMRRDGEDKNTATRIVRAQVDKLLAMEKQFFLEIGVDEYLCWVGKMPPFSVRDYYTLAVEDMARFGVRDVSQPWQSRDPSAPGYKGFYLDVVHINLH